MSKILIIDHFCQAPGEAGNNRYIYLAKMLCEYGHEVEIITSDFQHTVKKTRKIPQEAIDALPYKFTMLSEPTYPKNVCLQRFHSHHVFGNHLKRYLEGIAKPDLVHISIPSLDVGKIAADYCNNNKIPFVVDIQDLWPEAFKLVLNIPIISDICFAPMMRTANYIYTSADRILAVSETYKNRGLRNCKKDKEGMCVYLGTDMNIFDSYATNTSVEKSNGELWITYVGTLGHSYNIEIIIDALNLIADKINRKVVFKVIGNGPYMERFQKYAKNCKIPVDFMGRRMYEEMVMYLCHSDIAVNPIVKGAAQSIINKHADYAMSGLPIVNTQECTEYRTLITDYRCGINCDPDNSQQVADALLLLIEDEEKRQTMGKNSRKLAEERFNRDHTYRLIVKDIERLIEGKK